jgi:hypothetical protein
MDQIQKIGSDVIFFFPLFVSPRGVCSTLILAQHMLRIVTPYIYIAMYSSVNRGIYGHVAGTRRGGHYIPRYVHRLTDIVWFRSYIRQLQPTNIFAFPIVKQSVLKFSRQNHDI